MPSSVDSLDLNRTASADPTRESPGSTEPQQTISLPDAPVYQETDSASPLGAEFDDNPDLPQLLQPPQPRLRPVDQSVRFRAPSPLALDPRAAPPRYTRQPSRAAVYPIASDNNMSNPSRPTRASPSRRPQNQGPLTADQERMARGKSPLGEREGPSNISTSRDPRQETFSEVQKANELERILNNWEELAMRAMMRGETIAQTTLRCQKMQWGIEDDEGSEREQDEEIGVSWDDLESGEDHDGEADDGGRSAAGSRASVGRSGAGSRASGGSGSTGKGKGKERKTGGGGAQKGKDQKGERGRKEDEDEDSEEVGKGEGTFGRLRREVERERKGGGR